MRDCVTSLFCELGNTVQRIGRWVVQRLKYGAEDRKVGGTEVEIRCRG